MKRGSSLDDFRVFFTLFFHFLFVSERVTIDWGGIGGKIGEKNVPGVFGFLFWSIRRRPRALAGEPVLSYKLCIVAWIW